MIYILVVQDFKTTIKIYRIWDQWQRVACKLGICIHVIDQYKTCWILWLWKFVKTTPSKTTGEIFFRFSFGSHTLCKKKIDWCVNFTTPENKYNILSKLMREHVEENLKFIASFCAQMKCYLIMVVFILTISVE